MRIASAVDIVVIVAVIAIITIAAVFVVCGIFVESERNGKKNHWRKRVEAIAIRNELTLPISSNAKMIEVAINQVTFYFNRFISLAFIFEWCVNGNKFALSFILKL